MGDFNAKVEKGIVENVVYSYGLGIRNASGYRLNDWILPRRRICYHEHTIPTSFKVFIKKIFLIAITSGKTYSGADIHSDHHLAKIKLHLKRTQKQKKQQKSTATFVSAFLVATFSPLHYGAKAWIITDASCKRPDSFKIWRYNRMLRIPWIHHVSNNKVMCRLQKNTEW